MTREGFVVWLTGLPGAGKSTIAERVAAALTARGQPVEVLDGDAVRQALSPDLGFSRADRDAQTKRVAFMAALLARHGVAVLCPLVSPERAHRDRCRAWVPRFCEVHVTAPLDVLRARDPKGLYAKHARGEVDTLVGVTEPFETPDAPEVTCRTDQEPADDSARRIMAFLDAAGWLPPEGALLRA